jgi:hypothetical protein
MFWFHEILQELPQHIANQVWDSHTLLVCCDPYGTVDCSGLTPDAIEYTITGDFDNGMKPIETEP